MGIGRRKGREIFDGERARAAESPLCGRMQKALETLALIGGETASTASPTAAPPVPVEFHSLSSFVPPSR